MSPSPSRTQDAGPSSPTQGQDLKPPTVAAFSPTTALHTSSIVKQRSTILVHQKSPLLVATPPQVTRALAYSHPFLLPLNKLAGLLSWSSGDPWESFLLVAGFWGIVLYGDIVLRWTGPVLMVVGLILGMYSRRYSPLSSTGRTGETQKGHKREVSESSTKHQKSLDEIVETLRVLTSRCNILLEPLLLLTDFLSTQRTATSASTRPSLTKLFIRILLITPLWIILTLPPLYIITSRRVILTAGTLLLSWHSRPARVSRVILWRSNTIRRICSVITGLDLIEEKLSPPPIPARVDAAPPLPPRRKDQHNVTANLTTKRSPDSTGIRFTFILYENQRRWLGVGWTHSLLTYERAAWTDEHLNPAPSKDDFELPDVEGGLARWRWAEGSEWRVEGAGEGEEGSGKGASAGKGDSKGRGGGGWIYYDNKWNDGRRGQDSWGRYTRRRKWYRDAELVEVTASTEVTPNLTPNPPNHPGATLSEAENASNNAPPEYAEVAEDEGDTSSTKARKRRWFRRGSKSSLTSNGQSGSVDLDRGNEDDHHHDRDGDWLVGDDARMGFG
ncbi:MAG: peroxisome- protein [Pleopsidium flavum]|nr:MAG: peroxisome- protein [Pleopsidium flavum]